MGRHQPLPTQIKNQIPMPGREALLARLARLRAEVAEVEGQLARVEEQRSADARYGVESASKVPRGGPATPESDRKNTGCTPYVHKDNVDQKKPAVEPNGDRRKDDYPYVYSHLDDDMEGLDKVDDTWVRYSQQHTLVSENETKTGGEELYTQSSKVESNTDCAPNPNTKEDSSADVAFGWNAAYQDALERQDMARVQQITHDFEDLSRLYSRVILSELGLADAEKTVKPTSRYGGLAGGAKYVVRGIFFKLVKDPKVGHGRYIYGADKPRIDLAFKSAGADLRGANAYSGASLAIHGVEKSLRAPLQSVVDYAGHRVMCVALLPFDKGSLVYGGDNTNCESGSRDADARARADDVCKHFHLAAHLVKNQAIRVAGDVEIHRATDGRVYALDLARAFPPEDPKLCTHLAFEPQAIFFRTFRPEIMARLRRSAVGTEPASFDADALKSAPPALSCDALSGFSRGQSDAKKTADAAAIATKWLVNTWIPHVGRRLSARPRPGQRELLLFGVRETKPARGRNKLESVASKRMIQQAEIGHLVHYMGVSVRHMALLRSHLSDTPRGNQLWKLFTVDILARSLKHLSRAAERGVVVACGPRPSAFRLVSVVCELWTRAWHGHVATVADIAATARAKFGRLALRLRDSDGSSKPEAIVTLLLRQHRAAVVARCAGMLGWRFRHGVLKAVMSNSKENFSAADFLPRVPRSRGLASQAFAEAVCRQFGIGGSTADTVSRAQAGEAYIRAACLFDPRAVAHCEYDSGLGPFPDEPVKAFRTIQQLAEKGDVSCLFTAGYCYYVGRGVRPDLARAESYYARAAAKGHLSAQCRLAHLLEARGEVEAAVTWYRKAATAGHAVAQLNLGRMCMTGVGSEMAQNSSRGFLWFQRAATQGLREAQKELVRCYTAGSGIAKDLDLANFWREKVAFVSLVSSSVDRKAPKRVSFNTKKQTRNATMASVYRSPAGLALQSQALPTASTRRFTNPKKDASSNAQTRPLDAMQSVYQSPAGVALMAQALPAPDQARMRQMASFTHKRKPSFSMSGGESVSSEDDMPSGSSEQERIQSHFVRQPLSAVDRASSGPRSQPNASGPNEDEAALSDREDLNSMSSGIR